MSHQKSPNLSELAWLIKPPIKLSQKASMVEYLRWLRSPEIRGVNKDDAKLYLLQLIEEKLNNPIYSQQLKRLSKRTEKIVEAKNGISVRCTSSWRIRVGGIKGPESMLLPAFDSLGMPYIPSSTLRGVARAEALRELKTEEKVNRYFGSLDAEKSADRIGKVTFLDAYLSPKEESESGELKIDIANSIWRWDGDKPDSKLQYKPNPNLFLSLKKATFVIGILPRINNSKSQAICKKVKEWLIKGLEGGIGAQINSGYGRLFEPSKSNCLAKLAFPSEFFRVKFALQGQLIHNVKNFKNLDQPYKQYKNGNYKKDKNGNFVPDTENREEVRAIAFKSMLLYWFRMLGLGVLKVKTLQEWEGKLFGAIQPERSYGWVQVQTIDLIDYKIKNKQEGILSFSYSPQIPIEKKEIVKNLFKHLTWLMFRLGGVGQGARRPHYKRRSNFTVRGSSLNKLYSDDNSDDFWKNSYDMEEFKTCFQQHFNDFYQTLKTLMYGESEDKNFILKSIGRVSENKWTEAMDKNCQIWVVSEQDGDDKPYALKILHQKYHSLENYEYSKRKKLCGGINPAVPSPIWIANLEQYQVVTIFGCCEGVRQEYLKQLKSSGKCLQLFPLPEQS